MKLPVDECLSHTHVRRLADRGNPDAIHLIHVGSRRSRDGQLAAKALTDHHVIVRSNVCGFRPLLPESSLHRAAILVEQVDLDTTWGQIVRALVFIDM